MKVFYPSLFLFFLHTYLYGQPLPSNEVNILSPKAASIIKYGQYPVSLYTGLVDITVPVYTIEANGITVPITLKYHASGIKFDDVSNEVGLGWTLMAGGVITRSYKGAKDGLYETFSKDVTKFKTCNNDPSPYTNEYVSIREVENGSRGNYYDASIGRMDGEMDMYFFSFLNRSGSFCFPFLNSKVYGTAPSTGLFIPANGMKAVRNNQQIEITDTDGVYYKFEVKDVDQNQSYKEYYLTQIISADKADTITFTYDVVSALSSTYVRRPFINYSATISMLDPVPTFYHGQSGVIHPEVTESGGIFYQSLRPPRLTRIDFRGGYVSFEYAVVNNITTYDLQQIKIYSNAQSSPLRTISLTKSLFYNGEQRLDKVTFSNLQGQSYDYQFGYKGEPGNINNSEGIDYWGYFNGNNVPYGKRYLPAFDNMPFELQGYVTNRTASEYYMQGGILNKITYPTKGYSEFTYEAHKARYSLGTPVVTCGGLRIKEISNYLPDGSLAEKKWYKYGEGESGTGIANTYPDKMDFLTQSRTLITHADVGYSIRPHLCKIRYIDHYSTFPKISYLLSGSSVVYSQVTEYVGNDSEAFGKTVYRYEVFPDEKLNPHGTTYRMYSPDTYLRTNQWKTGNLLSKKVYKKEGTTYREIQSTVNSYKDINTSEFRNVHVLPYVEFAYDYSGGNIPDIKRNYCSPLWTEHRENFGGISAYGSSLSPYDYYNYYTSSGQRVLSSTQETIDGVSTYTSYDTYNEYGLPTNFTRRTSMEDYITTLLKYPTDFTYSPYTDMKSANILTPVIDKTTYKNGNLLKRESTTYQFLYNRFFAPKYYSEQFQDGNYETRFTYSYGSKGNIKEIFKDGATKGVYLWGYNNLHPIAKIRGAYYTQVESILGQTLIDRVGNATAPSSADLASINNLRTNPALSGAHITTYTYRPLIGMKSKTDPNGLTTQYEYDAFGRLIYEKDYEENILKKYNYQFVPSSAPSNIGVRFDESSRKYTISWEDNSSDETGFEVVISVDGLAFEPLITTGSNFQYAVDPTIRDVGQTVRYGVRSVSSSGASAYTYSGIYTVPSINAPSHVTASLDSGTGKYSVFWVDNSNIETNFKVEASVNEGPYTTIASSAPANITSYLDNNIYQIGTSVRYRVTATNGSEQSKGANSPKYTVPYISAPSDITVTYDNSTWTVQWKDNSDNEQGFHIYADTGDGFEQIGSVGSNSLSFYTPSFYFEGTLVTFGVTAYNKNGESEPSYSDEYETEDHIPVTPSDATVEWDTEGGIGGAKISFTDNADNEDGFVIELDYYGIWIERARRSLPATVPRTWKDEGVQNYITPGDPIKYRIGAYNAKNYNPLSWVETNSISVFYISAPSNITAILDNTTGKFTISWQDNAVNETNYKVEVSENGGGYMPASGLIAANTTSYLDDNVYSIGTTVQYRVSAVHPSGEADASSDVFTVPSINAPSNAGASYSNSTLKYTVTWTDNSSNETGFKVYRSLNSASFVEVGDVTAGITSWLDNVYYDIGNSIRYQVRAYNATGESSGASAMEQIVPGISDPSGIDAVFSTSTRKFTITWNDNSSNEQYFELQVNVDGGGWTVLDDEIETTNYIDDNIYEPGGIIQYRVRATNPNGASGWDESTEVSLPSSPTNGHASKEQGYGGILITWDDNSNDENRFKIYRNENGSGFISWTTAYADNTSKLDVSGLTWGSTYRYRISAITPSGETFYTETNSVLFLDPPETPSDLEVVRDGEDIVITWDDNSSDEDSYIVQVDYGLGGGWVTWVTLDNGEEIYSYRNENFSGEIGHRVGASNDAGISWSNEVYITIE